MDYARCRALNDYSHSSAGAPATCGFSPLTGHTPYAEAGRAKLSRVGALIRATDARACKLHEKYRGCRRSVEIPVKMPGAKAGWRHTPLTYRICSTSLYSVQRKKALYASRISFRRYCEEQSDEQSTIHPDKPGLLRCARNDETRVTVGEPLREPRTD
jgi:hypothetical protein